MTPSNIRPHNEEHGCAKAVLLFFLRLTRAQFDLLLHCWIVLCVAVSAAGWLRHYGLV